MARGLQADKQALIRRLKAVSYYRLSGYLFPFRNRDDSFKNGTTLEKVWRRYTFDRQLRCLVIDAIERVEIGIRTAVVYEFSHRFGPFGYLQNSRLPNLRASEHAQFLTRTYSETLRSKERFIVHFKDKYGDSHEMPPLWMVSEIMPFGQTSTFFRGVEKEVKYAVAHEYDLAFVIIESWLFALNTVRNICAHHGRLWNRELGIKPSIPKKDRRWHTPVQVRNNRIFGILTILKYMLNQIAPQSEWPDRLQNLLERYLDVPKGPMGFPANWEESPIWQ
jgi:abortive infection bacteriophage resistance protein